MELMGERDHQGPTAGPSLGPNPPNGAGRSATSSSAPVPATPRKDALDVIERIPSSERPLGELFLRLDLQTIERLTESKHIRPYLLTVTRSDEPITDLLDCLASERKEDELAEAGIELRTAAGEKKYNFVQYTPYSRIGLTPPSLAFVDFCKELQQDLDRALRKQTELLAPYQLKDRKRADHLEPLGPLGPIEPLDGTLEVTTEPMDWTQGGAGGRGDRPRGDQLVRGPRPPLPPGRRQPLRVRRG